jgi:hypothetical protein
MSDAGLKGSLRRPTLDSLFWKAKKRIKNQPAAFGVRRGERKTGDWKTEGEKGETRRQKLETKLEIRN